MNIILIVIGVLVQLSNDYWKDWRIWSKRTSGDYQDYNIIEDGQNTDKSADDLRRRAVIQTPVKDHQLKNMWKTLKE